MIDWSQCSDIERAAERLSGAWCFVGSRVPVTALFENLEGGATIQDCLEWFPGVSRTQITGVLQHAQRSVKAP